MTLSRINKSNINSKCMPITTLSQRPGKVYHIIQSHGRFSTGVENVRLSINTTNTYCMGAWVSRNPTNFLRDLVVLTRGCFVLLKYGKIGQSVGMLPQLLQHWLSHIGTRCHTSHDDSRIPHQLLSIEKLARYTLPLGQVLPQATFNITTLY